VRVSNPNAEAPSEKHLANVQDVPSKREKRLKVHENLNAEALASARDLSMNRAESTLKATELR
jgi:hypothetical protein